MRASSDWRSVRYLRAQGQAKGRREERRIKTDLALFVTVIGDECAAEALRPAEARSVGYLTGSALEGVCDAIEAGSWDRPGPTF